MIAFPALEEPGWGSPSTPKPFPRCGDGLCPGRGWDLLGHGDPIRAAGSCPVSAPGPGGWWEGWAALGWLLKSIIALFLAFSLFSRGLLSKQAGSSRLAALGLGCRERFDVHKMTLQVRGLGDTKIMSPFSLFVGIQRASPRWEPSWCVLCVYCVGRVRKRRVLRGSWIDLLLEIGR